MENENKKLDAREVAAFLKQNPGFFRSYPDVVAELDVPHETGATVSLVEHQSRILREKNRELHTRLQTLVENARRNDRLFEHTRRLTLDLLDAQSMEEVEQALQECMRNLYKVDYAAITLFVPCSTMLSVVDVEQQTVLLRPFSRKDVFCGQYSVELMKHYFQEAPDVGSMAACQLKNDLGILALGHKDPEYFKSSMDTLFLNYVAEVVSRRLSVLL